MTHLRKHPVVTPLTIRERQVLAAYITEGRYDLGARWLGISPSTFRNHLTNIYRKTGSRNALQALWRMGYVDPTAVLV